MYRKWLIIINIQRIEGVNEKLYAYALAQVKMYQHVQFHIRVLFLQSEGEEEGIWRNTILHFCLYLIPYTIYYVPLAYSSLEYPQISNEMVDAEWPGQSLYTECYRILWLKDMYTYILFSALQLHMIMEWSWEEEKGWGRDRSSITCKWHNWSSYSILGWGNGARTIQRYLHIYVIFW